MRHWKEKFDPAGPFIFAKSVQLETGRAMVGDDVPDELAANGHRMQTWFRGGYISMKNFDHDAGHMVEPEPLPYKELGGAWFLFPDGTKAHGKKQLEAKLASLAEV